MSRLKTKTLLLNKILNFPDSSYFQRNSLQNNNKNFNFLFHFVSEINSKAEKFSHNRKVLSQKSTTPTLLEPRIAVGICEREFSEDQSTQNVLNTVSAIAGEPAFSKLPSVNNGFLL